MGVIEVEGLLPVSDYDANCFKMTKDVSNLILVLGLGMGVVEGGGRVPGVSGNFIFSRRQHPY